MPVSKKTPSYSKPVCVPQNFKPSAQGWLSIRHVGTTHGLPICDIIWLQARRVYTIVHARRKHEYVVGVHLKKMEERLKTIVFFRLNKSCIVNMLEIKEYRRKDRGGIIFLKDDTILNVSQRNKKAFERSLHDYPEIEITRSVG